MLKKLIIGFTPSQISYHTNYLTVHVNNNILLVNRWKQA